MRPQEKTPRLPREVMSCRSGNPADLPAFTGESRGFASPDPSGFAPTEALTSVLFNCVAPVSKSQCPWVVKEFQREWDDTARKVSAVLANLRRTAGKPAATRPESTREMV